ncbi:MAG: S8 family serine peptidase [Candidatus Obscuribacterales bacterium]|nr:S8 family serine peptidase [Steroidobacteraceae bacterium]
MSAAAQVPLPAQVPALPPIQLPVSPRDAIGTVTGASQRLQDVRRLRVRELLRVNRQVLEADPNGAPIIRAEIAAYAPSENSLRLAIEAGFRIVRESTLPALDIRIVILAPRPGVATRTALRRLRRADRDGSYDFNHVYVESGIATAVAAVGAIETFPLGPASSARVGLIDTGVERKHPSLRTSSIKSWGCNSAVIPGIHGTAVASLLVGHSTKFSGAAAGGNLFSADVYCSKPTGGAVENIVAAFAWLAQEKVAVVNVSLVGPPNLLLEKTVAAMLARGHVIVAAVGNDGPAAPPLYPAAYKGVIGVTGVDARRRVLVEAERGAQVDFAAPGSDMGAASTSDGYVAVRGTSFAAPIVAGLLALRIHALDPTAAQQSIADFAAQAIDLGARGVDKVYGQGLVGESVRIDPKSLVANEQR